MHAAKRNEKLRVTTILKYSVPFSCGIEGIQMATKCTIGNRKLRLKSSSGIAARFELQRGEGATFAVNPAAFEILKKELLTENVPREELWKLAHLCLYARARVINNKEKVNVFLKFVLHIER
jgi:formylmethanofuran dehydrogenase subunit E